MRGKNQAAVQRGLSSGSVDMNLFNDDPLLQGMAMFGNGGLLLSHTPPNIGPGSYEISHMKRARAGSISGRLRSASDLEEKGLIDKSQKGVLKDLIISGDSALQAALDLYDRGDASQLEAMMERGLLDRRDSLDLLQDLDFGIMDLGVSDSDIPSLPDSDVNNVMNNSINKMGLTPNTPTTTTNNNKAFDAGNDTIDTIRRKDSGGGGGDFGQGAGGGGDVKGSGAGDGVSPPVGGVNAEVSRGLAAGTTDSLRRGRSSAKKSAAVVAEPRNSSKDGGLGGSGDDAAVGDRSMAAPPCRERGGVIEKSTRVEGVEGDDSEQKIDLGTDGFDIGDMAFDTAFDTAFDFNEQEDDVGMKEGVVAAATAAAAADGATLLGPTAVGPLRVVTPSQLAAQQRKQRQQQRQQEQRGATNTQDDDGRDHHEGPGGIDSESPSGQHEDDDAAVLASYGILDGGPTAPIGDFSPQFKFSFTDDIHLDLGGGLKDELRDLDSLSEPLPDQHLGSKSVESYPSIMGMNVGGQGGLAYRQQHQLLSRGGPVIKHELGLPASSTASQTTVRLTSAALAAAAPAGGHRAEFTAAGVGTGGKSDIPPYYTNAAAVSSSTAGAGNARGTTAGGAGMANVSGGLHQHSQLDIASQSHQASASGHGGTGAVRGRPVVSGMGVMVGRGPVPHHHQRSGTGSGTVGDENRKFVGAYSPEARRKRIERFLEKREHRVWTKMVKYDVRKNFADTRMRVKGRFVKKEDEALLREVMACA
ncbi:unnamed protein product [Sphacelaria rigidula]